MADTWRKTNWVIFEGEKCSDCSGKKVVIKYNGYLVPKGELGKFYSSYWKDRQQDYEEGKKMRSLGTIRKKTTATS